MQTEISLGAIHPPDAAHLSPKQFNPKRDHENKIGFCSSQSSRLL
jgi:hypothetical protein